MTPFSWQRAVIKVGSALVAPNDGDCSSKHLLAIARFIALSHSLGKEIILVSSGSVAAGRNSISCGQKPSVSEKQAMAAIGQTKMMANWSRFFEFPCAQILLTHEDLQDRHRYVNVKNTLRELLNNGALPILNENDSVAVDEIKVGDNDNLGAYAAIVAEADTLIICTDVDGLYDADPRRNPNAKLIENISAITPSIKALAGGAGSRAGTGGMITKLEAAEKCIQSGIQTLLVNGEKSEVFDALIDGKCKGSLFSAGSSSASAKAHWLAHSLKSKGQIHIDEGAYHALQHSGASLLAVGIKAVSGNFTNNDATDICWNKQVIAKGICLYSKRELESIQGLRSGDIENKLGFSYGDTVVHRDDLVLI
ncbi:glutamate 5-kinase [Glaciecola sp. MH2013]|uniref:glutamate 5-kinase n=1 Tax=Glaciecola sp. MH2013 TaxID=2785524 RepID=UPI00189CD2B6|nr:glutamate 5-kinase [Glaciecola sp. MH2013]MBF7074466.1 glutamate 5-kinase [Glaciecola sp. MH2013]